MNIRTNGNYINMYYGTSDEKLGDTIEIDPEYNTGKFFEFGNGFYLTVSKDMAASYAEIGAANKFLIESTINEEFEKNVVYNFSCKCYVHELIIDYKELMKEKKIIFETIDEYKNVIKETLQGYSKDRDYRPNRLFTFGLLCGAYWDKNIDKVKSPYDKFIEKCGKNMSDVKQLCIHKRMQNGGTKGFRYLPYCKCNKKTAFEYGSYVYKEELNE